MKKLLIATAMIVATGSTMAQGIFFQLDAGFSQLKAEDSKATKFTPSIAFGFKSNNTRTVIDYTNYGKIEEEANQGSASAKASLKAQGVGLSFIADFKNQSEFTPYLGIRLAYNRLQYEGQVQGILSTAQVSKKSTEFGYGALAGVTYNLTENVKTDLGIHYNYLGKVGTEPYSIKAHQYGAKLGIRYDF